MQRERKGDTSRRKNKNEYKKNLKGKRDKVRKWDTVSLSLNIYIVRAKEKSETADSRQVHLRALQSQLPFVGTVTRVCFGALIFARV